MDNQITVVVASDGRIIHKEQNGVFRRSNKQNRLVALLDFPSSSVVKVNFIRSDGVKPNSQYMTYTEQQEYNGATYSKYEYLLTDFQLNATGLLVGSLNIQNGATLATSGDFTIDIEASEEGKDDVAPTDPNQFDEALQHLMQTDAILLDRTVNVPNLVADINKVAPNAFTFTNNSGIESAPIVLTGGELAPIPVNAASTIKIPLVDGWQPVYAADGTTVTGYKAVISAAVHGQMHDNATARDLWVSFDEAEQEAFKGAYEDYTVDAAGNITVAVTTPIAMTVRVWNGMGLHDDIAQKAIAAETERAEAAEQQLQENIDTETENLQDQIDAIVSENADLVARRMIAEETARAEAAEQQLREDLPTMFGVTIPSTSWQNNVATLTATDNAVIGRLKSTSNIIFEASDASAATVIANTVIATAVGDGTVTFGRSASFTDSVTGTITVISF